MSMIPHRVLACIPCYHTVEPNPFIHFLVLAQESGIAEAEKRWKIRWNVGGPKVKPLAVRNGAANFMLNGGATELLFMDDDMIPIKGMVDRLLSHDVDIVAPLFFRDGLPPQPLVFNLNGNGKPIPMWDYPRNQLFEAPGGVGTGVMLIKRRVFEGMDPPYFRPSMDPEMGEDIEFCLRARLLGFGVWCDSSICIDQMGLAAPVPRGT